MRRHPLLKCPSSRFPSLCFVRTAQMIAYADNRQHAVRHAWQIALSAFAPLRESLYQVLFRRIQLSNLFLGEPPPDDEFSRELAMGK